VSFQPSQPAYWICEDLHERNPSCRAVSHAAVDAGLVIRICPGRREHDIEVLSTADPWGAAATLS